MRIYNEHERIFNLPVDKVGQAIDSLAGPANILWPVAKWIPMELDQGLQVGSSGGHGFIRYTVGEYVPGKRAVFQFDREGALAAFDGRHYFEVVPRRNHTILRHVVEGDCDFKNWMVWHLLIGPLHDALLEDGLDMAENSLTGSSKTTDWNVWVRFLLYMLARKQAKETRSPNLP